MIAQKGLMHMNIIYPMTNERSLHLFVHIKQISAHGEVHKEEFVYVEQFLQSSNICSYNTALLTYKTKGHLLSPHCTFNYPLHTLHYNTHKHKYTLRQRNTHMHRLSHFGRSSLSH